MYLMVDEYKCAYIRLLWKGYKPPFDDECPSVVEDHIYRIASILVKKLDGVITMVSEYENYVELKIGNDTIIGIKREGSDNDSSCNIVIKVKTNSDDIIIRVKKEIIRYTQGLEAP